MEEWLDFLPQQPFFVHLYRKWYCFVKPKFNQAPCGSSHHGFSPDEYPNEPPPSPTYSPHEHVDVHGSFNFILVSKMNLFLENYTIYIYKKTDVVCATWWNDVRSVFNCSYGRYDLPLFKVIFFPDVRQQYHNVRTYDGSSFAVKSIVTMTSWGAFERVGNRFAHGCPESPSISIWS